MFPLIISGMIHHHPVHGKLINMLQFKVQFSFINAHIKSACNTSLLSFSGTTESPPPSRRMILKGFCNQWPLSPTPLPTVV